MPASIFEETKVANDFYTVIMFLNEQPEMKKMQIQSQLGLTEITPVKSSLLILPPNTEYNLGHFYDLEQLYAITSFTKDDII
jgi:bacterioferritin (cytochrome b1)